MPSGLLSRSRVLSGCALLIGALAVGGCGAAGPSAVTVTGSRLTIYLSAPASLSGNSQAQDVIDAEKLAFSQLSGKISGFTLTLRVLTADKISDNARTAIDDKTSVAYLGEVVPGASVDSLGITNAQQLVQVSPTAAAPVPKSDFESFSTYGRTFASMAPASDQQAQTILGTTGGKAFVRDFRNSYTHAPASQAIFGYVAMAAALKALHNAGPGATNRGTIVSDFFALRDVQLLAGSGGPELGTYTVNKVGTVTITPASG